MANLGGILGAMMATGMAGRNRRGPQFGASPMGMLSSGMMGGMMGSMMGGGGRAAGGGGIKHAAGLAALGYLAYRAYGEYKRNNPSSGLGRGGAQSGGLLGRALDALGGGSSETTESETPDASAAAGSSGGLGDRLAAMLRPEHQAEPERALGDRKALLLIRAMIAAANADGQIDANERQSILARLEQAGASDEDRQFVEQELAAPKPVDSLLAEVGDEESAEQVFVASVLAVGEGSPAEHGYLQDLAGRLGIDQARAQSLQQGLSAG